MWLGRTVVLTSAIMFAHSDKFVNSCKTVSAD